jgi:arylsulfatase A-like enzyme
MNKIKTDPGYFFSAATLMSLLATGCNTDVGNNKTSQKPNVIFVFADQWRAQATGYAGDPNAITPVIDKLATESVVFTTAVCTAPVSSPYRGSLLTGQYPLSHGIFMNDVSLNPEINSMGKIFGKAGYTTAYIGKWHLDGHGRSAYIPPERRQGFEYWKVLECTHSYNNSLYYANEDTIPSKWKGYDAYYQTLDAAEYIREHAKGREPFLMVLSWGPPHNPYNTAPEEYRKKYEDFNIKLRPNVPEQSAEKAKNDLKGYYAHINALDDCMAILLKAIKDTGIEENTIFVFTSDHGDMLYSQGMQRKQKPFDESILVPFILRYPRVHGNRNITIDAPIGTPDILPTLLGLSGIEIPGSVEGEDMSVYLAGRKKLKDNNVLILSVTPFGEWIRKRGGVEYRGIRSRQFTYVRNLDGPWLLYDNKSDPYQQTNLIDNPEYTPVQAKMEKALQLKLKEMNDEFLPGEDYLKKWGYNVDSTGTVPYKN